MILLLSSLYFRYGKVTVYPDFTPTPKMLDLHADKGVEPWEIYSWCIRDVISKHSGIKKLDEKLNLKDKLAYEKLMCGDVDKAEINGHFWEYSGD